MSPTVTVICPIRNEEKFIGRCLRALVNQTYDLADMEILVVDGMSDDGTRPIVEHYEEAYPQVKLIENPKRIVPAALNLGVRHAKGKYIVRIDGHAEAAPDFIEQSIRTLVDHKVDCAGGPIESVNQDDTGRAIALAMSFPFGVGNSHFRTSQRELFVDTLAFPAFQAGVFERCGLFDEELVRCQDDEFHFRLRKYGGRILLTPNIRSKYFPRSSFRKLWSQYFGYGFFKVRVLQKHLFLMRWRHFVPALFVSMLTLTFTLALLAPSHSWLFVMLIACYFGASILAAAIVCLKHRVPFLHKIMLSFWILHFAYGSGFLCGLAKFARRWGEPAKFEPVSTSQKVTV